MEVVWSELEGDQKIDERSTGELLRWLHCWSTENVAWRGAMKDTRILTRIEGDSMDGNNCGLA